MQFFLGNPTDIVALASLLVATFSMIFGAVALFTQRTHNKKSVLPIGEISLSNYMNHIRIELQNNGIGPLIITGIKTFKESEEKEYPIDWFPDESIVWVTFRKNLIGAAIIPSSKLILLQYDVNLKKKKDVDIGNQIRTILKGLVLEFHYKDVYGKKYVTTRPMDWFGQQG